MTNNKILYAEDNRNVRDIVQFTLNKYNLDVYEDGNSLDKRLEQGSDGISIVITDNQMPGPNGSMIIEKYANKEGFKGKVPFVLFYGGEKEIGEEAIKNGAAAYLLKGHNTPVDLKNLIDKLTNNKTWKQYYL